MTSIPLSNVLFDIGPLAAAPERAAVKRLVLRTAVHVGLRWILCPDTASQRLAGECLFDIPAWRPVVPLNAAHEARDVLGRIRRNAISVALAAVPAGALWRDARNLEREGIIGALGAHVESAAQLRAAMRTDRLAMIVVGSGVSIADSDLAKGQGPGALRFVRDQAQWSVAGAGPCIGPISPREFARAMAGLGVLPATAVRSQSMAA